MSNYIRITLTAIVLCAGSSGATFAQEGVDNSWVGANGDWANSANWSKLGVPDANLFGEYANISNGGVANVTSPIFEQPGQVILGLEAEESGTLIIANGGVLTTVDLDGALPTSGEVSVGLNGTGHLTVQPGGSLIVDTNLNVNGLAGSSVTLGGVGPGATTVTAGFSANFNRNVRIIGPNVDLTANAVNFGGENTYTAQIIGATHSALKSTNGANVNGQLRLEISGIAPTIGTHWNLIDAPTIAGQFTSIDVSAAPALGFGQVYEYNAVAAPTSVNGMFGRVSVTQKLVLNVNRATGVASIANGIGPISIDGYQISSTHGSLTPGTWTSLQSQGVADWRRSPQAGTVNFVGELKPTGSTAIVSGAPRAMGNLFQYPNATEFGTEWEDLTFEYFTPDGKVTQGLINYTGAKRHNNLVLVVDPATGSAQIQNQSNLSVNIDGYQILSDSGSLRPANGQWLSLDDNNREGGDWRESNATVNQLVELKPAGSSLMSGGSTFLSMGQMFKTIGSGGTQDLVFEYLFPGETEFREGAVVYGALAVPSLAADFNNDNTVNGLDLAVWKGAFGSGPAGDADNDNDTDGSDFLVWQRQLGMSVTPTVAAAAAIPEPGAAALAGLGALSLVIGARRNRLPRV